MPGCPIYAAVDPTLNRVYGGSQCNDTISTIDGATNTVLRNTAAGGTFSYVVTNPVTGQVYAVVQGVTKKVDPNTGALSTASFSGSIQAVNTATNRIYSQSGNTTLVIDGSTEAGITTLAAGGPVAANPVKNHIIVADNSVANASVVKFFDGSTHALIGQTNIGPSLGSIAVNSSTASFDVQLQVDGAGTRTFDVVGEGRQVTATDNAISDHFDGLGVHIYVSAPDGWTQTSTQTSTPH
jgi:hypothetical protein